MPLQCLQLPKKPNFDQSLLENKSIINKSTTLTLTTQTALPTKKSIINLTETPIVISTPKIVTASIKETIIIVNCIPQDSIDAECSWKKLNDNDDSSDASLVGYRIILESQNSQSNNFELNNQVFSSESSYKQQQRQRKFISVVGAQERRVLLQSLLPDTYYRFRVQPLTVHGLSTDLYETFFNTKPLKKSKFESKNISKSHNIKQNNDELTHSIIENSLDPLSLLPSIGTRSFVHLPFVCILIILILIIN